MSDQQNPVPATTEFVGDAKTLVPAIIKETKAGYKTTEFWLAIAGLLAVNLNGVVMTLPDRYQAVATAFIAGLYALARGAAKSSIPAVEPGPVD